jgi:hypothetical protein
MRFEGLVESTPKSSKRASKSSSSDDLKDVIEGGGDEGGAGIDTPFENDLDFINDLVQ